MSTDNKELDKDTVRLLRAVMKISSALNDYDTIVYEKRYFKYNFKRVSTTWAKATVIHTAFLMKELAKEDEKLLAEVYTSLDEASRGITAGDDSRTALILMYAKLFSAMEDIDSMEESRDTFYPMFLYEHSKRATQEMRKEEMINFAIDYDEYCHNSFVQNQYKSIKSAEQYYKETYETK